MNRTGHGLGGGRRVSAIGLSLWLLGWFLWSLEAAAAATSTCTQTSTSTTTTSTSSSCGGSSSGGSLVTVTARITDPSNGMILTGVDTKTIRGTATVSGPSTINRYEVFYRPRGSTGLYTSIGVVYNISVSNGDLVTWSGLLDKTKTPPGDYELKLTVIATTGESNQTAIGVGVEPEIRGIVTRAEAQGGANVVTAGQTDDLYDGQDIADGIVVWQDSRNSTTGSDIYLCNLAITNSTQTGYCFDDSKHVRLTTATGDQTHPAIAYNARLSKYQIVWQDANSDLYLCTYDSSTNACTSVNGTQITATGTQQHPDIAGDYLVWQDDRNGNLDVYACNQSITSGTPGACGSATDHWQVTSRAYWQGHPAISGSKLVWQDLRNDDDGICSSFGGVCNYDIYLCDLAITGSTQNRYCFDEAKHEQVTCDPSTSSSKKQVSPAISGDYLVWRDNRNWNVDGNFDIYLCDLTLGPCIADAATCSPTAGNPNPIQITKDGSAQELPDISGPHVVWTDWRNGQPNIYTCTYSTGVTPPACVTEKRLTYLTASNQTFPSASNQLVVWYDSRNSGDVYVGSTLGYGEGWEMVSVPHTVSDMYVGALFPHAKSSSAFKYSSGYVAENPLVLKTGYWVKFGPDSGLGFLFNLLSGTKVTSTSMTLTDRWNLIGTILIPVPVTSSNVTFTGGTLDSGFIGEYDPNIDCNTHPELPYCPYQQVSILLPGRSYWVKTTGGGTLTLNGGGLTRPLPKPNLTGLSTVTITDNANPTNSQVLRFGLRSLGVWEKRMLIKGFYNPSSNPDISPYYDVRFTSDRTAETFTTLPTAQTFNIVVNGASNSLGVACQNNQPASYTANLLVGGTPYTCPKTLTGVDSGTSLAVQVVPPPPRCGDGICNGAETCKTCSSDCGVCLPTTKVVY